MENILPLHEIEDAVAAALAWIRAELLSVAGLAQIAAIALSFALAAAARRPLRRALGAAFQRAPRAAGLQRLENAVIPLAPALLWLLALWLISQSAERTGPSPPLVRSAASLLGAWVAIRLASGVLRDASLARLVAIVAWAVAALGIVGLLGPAVGFLDSIAFSLGNFRLSLWLLVKALLTLAVLLWVAAVTGRVLTARVERLSQLTPSARVLFAKAITAGLAGAAVVIALTASGVDLTALAVIGGAVGLGLGFGLQKVVSNLVSGVILLIDRSIKPGDVIELGETYGWITFLGARYAAVQTRDRKEWLIPNEDLITNRVVNWSRSDNLLRLHAGLRVAYGTDLRQAIALAEEAARGVERVVAAPAPLCLVTEFSDVGIELDLRFWIRDPQNGTANVRSAVMLRVWDAFRANGVRIPYPRLHLRIERNDDGSAGYSNRLR